jgi:hypothetical protein
MVKPVSCQIPKQALLLFVFLAVNRIWALPVMAGASPVPLTAIAQDYVHSERSFNIDYYSVF